MFTEFLNSFLLGLATPLTAACVLPLYPGFISYLTDQFDGSETRKTYAMFGTLAAAGVISFMLLFGLVFTTLIQASLTAVTEIVSPFAFTVLGLLSVPMILGKSLENFLPSFDAPGFEDPLKNAFGFGFFFGAVVLPCNPGYIAVFLARATLFTSPVSGLSNFLLFGLGIGFPLVAFSAISSAKSREVINLLKTHEKRINQASGLLMLSISIYYMVFVFEVLPF